MKKIIFAILLTTFSVSNFFGQTSVITDEEYEFYTNLLNQKNVITRSTYQPDVSYLPYAKVKMRSLPQELVNDFNLKNDKSYRIENKLGSFRFSDDTKPNLDTDKKIVFVWNAVETVSRVAFTKDRKQALVYFLQTYEGTNSAYGAFYWYIRKNGEWKIKKQVAIPIF